MVSQSLQALNQLSTIIAFGATLDNVFNTALGQMVAFMEADLGTIQLLDDHDTLRTVAIHGEISNTLSEVISEFTLTEGGIQSFFETDHAHVIVNMTETLPMGSRLTTLLQQEGFDTAIVVPLKMKGTSIGWLNVSYHTTRTVPRERLMWFEAMTNQISIAFYNAQLLADLHAKQTALQEAWKSVAKAQEMERSRLSRELHDEVGQALTSLMLRMKALQIETDVEVIGDRLNGLRYLAGKTLEEVRRISMDLHPVVFDELGLVPAIRSYVQECSNLSKVDIRFETKGTVYGFRPESEIACYRAVQEGLTNIIRHAQADKARIELIYDEQSIKLSICDNGVGFSNSDRANGMGLMGMHERVRLAGGSLSVITQPGEGVTLSMIFPGNIQQ